MKKSKAFTIIELIVVITILAILWTIWFISFSSHLVKVRDTTRQEQIVWIYKWLEAYSTRNLLPLPDDNVEIKANWVIIWYQWYAWKNVLSIIWYNKWWKDPRDEAYFSYFIPKDKKSAQLMWYLEDQTNLQFTQNIKNISPVSFPITSQVYALDYSKRYPTVHWKKLWILTESWTNIPVHEVSSIVSSWYLDVATTTKSYSAIFSDKSKLTWTWNVLSWLEKLLDWWQLVQSCKTLLKVSPKFKGIDWYYLISPSTDKVFLVYCDMTTDGWGWIKVKDRTKWWIPDSTKLYLWEMENMMFHYNSWYTWKEHKYAFYNWKTPYDNYQKFNSLSDVIDVILWKKIIWTVTRNRHTWSLLEFTWKNVWTDKDPCHTDEKIIYNWNYNFRSIKVLKEEFQMHWAWTPSFWLWWSVWSTSKFQNTYCGWTVNSLYSGTFTDFYVR